MNDVRALVLALLLVFCPYVLVHAEISEPIEKKRFTVGGAVGYHDVDTDN